MKTEETKPTAAITKAWDRLTKVKCPSCEWTGTDNELQKEIHPFKYPHMAGVREYIYGCPECDTAFDEIPWEL